MVSVALEDLDRECVSELCTVTRVYTSDVCGHSLEIVSESDRHCGNSRKMWASSESLSLSLSKETRIAARRLARARGLRRLFAASPSQRTVPRFAFRFSDSRISRPLFQAPDLDIGDSSKDGARSCGCPEHSRSYTKARDSSQPLSNCNENRTLAYTCRWTLGGVRDGIFVCWVVFRQNSLSTSRYLETPRFSSQVLDIWSLYGEWCEITDCVLIELSSTGRRRLERPRS